VSDHRAEVVDATRRTRLALERTYLAWWRTGLTCFAVSFAAGRLVPELSGGANWPYEVIGVAFAVVGVAITGYGYVRNRDVGRALGSGSELPSSDRAALVFATFGVVLGVCTAILLIASR
jgi:putative membrane protein